MPQNLGYSVNGIERKRTNGQVTFQFKPTDAITTTLDYTYSENKVHTQRNELSVWFNFGPSSRAAGRTARWPLRSSIRRPSTVRNQRPVDGRR